MRRPPAPALDQNAFRRNGRFLPEAYPFHRGVSTGKVKASMDVNVLWVIVLLGLVLFGGRIEFNGVLNRLRRHPESREITDGERKMLDK